MVKEIISTYEAAKMLNVDISTVKKWIDDEKMKAFRTPGGHRRIARKDFIKFSKTYHFPVKELSEARTRILVVDDEKSVRESVSKMLRKKFPEAEVHVSGDGFTAGKILASEEIDLLLLDIRMPGLDGYDVMRQIKKDSRLGDPYIIIITGFHSEEMEEDVRRLGAEKVLLKPFGIKELTDAVSKALSD